MPVSHPAGLPACAILEEVIQPDQLQAAEATLQFMYTQELPQPLNPILLLTVSHHTRPSPLHVAGLWYVIVFLSFRVPHAWV